MPNWKKPAMSTILPLAPIAPNTRAVTNLPGLIPLINPNGFQCLGSQRRLFPNHNPAFENNPDVKVIV